MSTLAVVAEWSTAEDSYPPVTPAADPARGAGIQRAMRLMATSTPAHRNHVRVLFYGQSITNSRDSLEIAAADGRSVPISMVRIYRPSVGREPAKAEVCKPTAPGATQVFVAD